MQSTRARRISQIRQSRWSSLALRSVGAGIVIGALAMNAAGVEQQSGTSTPSKAPAQDAAKQNAPKDDASKSAGIGLKVGESMPSATMLNADGKDVKLADVAGKAPMVVVFYRGGWCPYCNKHLSQWAKHSEEVKSLGASLVAITPEKPDAAKETSEKDKLDFAVLTDAKLEAAKGFKLLFAMSEDTQKKYKGYGVDLSTRNSSKTWELPHPGTFVIDAGGVVRYASVDTDYTKRPDPEEALKVLRELVAAKKK